MTSTAIPAEPPPGDPFANAAAGPTASTRLDAATLARLGALVIQLGLVALLLKQLRLESRALYQLLLLTAVAFPVHALLPRERRLPFFALVSVAGLILVLKLKAALLVLGIGAMLVGICHLPVRWGFRLLLLAAAGLGLALLRNGTIPSPVPDGVWPVLGAIFMFRLALYAHALRLGEAPTGFWPTLGYFAMLPNVAFPLFPVVDYKGFNRHHYDAPDFLVYERGMRWIVRGVAHLVLYRLVYHLVSMDPADVVSLGELVRFMVGTFLLYLRVSGQFHLIVGLLHLFGFNLPETHHLYYLASSVTDLWRRINLYWTDFMMKLVYYPSFFRLRRIGQQQALLLSTAVVFVATWALHGWQTFWLLGTPHFTVPDALFWGVLGVLVLATTVYEKRRPRRLPARQWRLGRALAVTGTFLGMSALWSLWSSESLAEWLSLFHAARETTGVELFWLAGLLLAGLAVAGYPWGAAQLTPGPAAPPSLRLQLTDGALRAAGVAGMLALSFPAVQLALPGPMQALALSASRESLNARDEALLQRGYYEQLNAADRTGGQVWDRVARRPRDWGRELFYSDNVEPVDGVLLARLRPDLSLRYKGAEFSTNEWGMRDRSYPRERVPGSYRIAVLGPSLVMGYGVADGEPFEAQFEDRLTGRYGPGRIEVLNFGFEGHSLTQQLATFEREVRPFAPDLVLLSLTPIEHRLAAEHIRRMLYRGAAIEYPYLADLVAKTGLTGRSSHTEAVHRVRPHASALARSALRALNERITVSGFRAAVMGIRMPGQPQGQLRSALDLAEEAGLPVLDLTDAYQGANEDALRAAPWDRHPGPEGNRLLALALERELHRTLLLPELPPHEHSGD